MTGAMRDALELIRSLKEQYPDETEDQLISRFLKELEGDQALKRAVLRDVFNELLQELGEAAELKGIGAPTEADARCLLG
jgi:hypothetical protein